MSLTPLLAFAIFSLTLGAELPMPKLDGRIVGGDPTTIQKYPYQLSLRSYGFHICGAAIIAENFALTAAHCVSGESPSSITLHARTTFQSEPGIKHQAISITIHPLYSFSDYDYAVIEVDAPFSIGEPGIQKIELCTSEPDAGQIGVVSGWGTLYSGGETPDQLQVVNVPIISRKDCQNKYSMYRITRRMICAQENAGGKDSCQGDSGGPLVVDGKLCGIVSWGLGCADRRYPGVYANVVEEKPWIESVIENKIRSFYWIRPYY